MIRQREERVRDPAYMGWVAKLPCVACMVHGKVNWQVQVAHVRAGSPEHGKRETGKAEKPSDRWVLPLCMPHHTGDVRRVAISQHAMDELEFWAAHGINPFELCIELYDAYLDGPAPRGFGVAIISKAAARGRRILEGGFNPMTFTTPERTTDGRGSAQEFYAAEQAAGRLPCIALSIQQPWAWLIVNGWKSIENRDWRRQAPDRALIHTGKKIDDEALQALASHQHPVAACSAPPVALLDAFDRDYEAIKSGALCGGFVGVATFGQPVSDSGSKWFVGPWGFPVSDAKPLPFLPWRGMPSFFPVKVTP